MEHHPISEELKSLFELVDQATLIHMQVRRYQAEIKQLNLQNTDPLKLMIQHAACRVSALRYELWQKIREQQIRDAAKYASTD